MNAEPTLNPGVCSEEDLADETPGVSIVEQSLPPSIEVSDECLSPCPSPGGCSSSGGHKAVRIQDPEDTGAQSQAGPVQELFFNRDLGGTVSDVAKSCSTDDCEASQKRSCDDPKESKKPVKHVPLCKVIQESGASSVAETGSGSWDADARASYYHHKLMSTLQVLANKEETVRVQGESLRMAEARIASLTARAQRLRDELDEKAQELRSLQLSSNITKKVDISVTADSQEVENQKHVVKTLQTNLSVIEDLYRECFYETAKQEELIEMLRKSYLDVRLMDKDKCDQIGRLQDVINTQKWSLERCQDMAMEVEGLKLEISNFLSSSNNDSGMWERSEDSINGEVIEDLQQIAAQLLQLRTMLTGECTCGLEVENMRLKELNETMQIQVGEMQQRVSECELALADKENRDLNCRDDIEEKEQELNNVRQRLAELEQSVGDRKGTCDVLSSQLRQAQVSIEDQTRELIEARQRCQGHEDTINQLNEELEKANHIIQEGRGLREEVSEMQRAVCASGRRVRALADELARAHAHCQSLDSCYREKSACAATLQSQLEEAHARGEELCEKARGVVSGVQQWMRRMRAKHRDQEKKIKELEMANSSLHRNRDGLIEISTEPCRGKCRSLAGQRATKTNHEVRRKCASRTASCECIAIIARRNGLAMDSPSSEISGYPSTSRAEERRPDRTDTGGSRTVICDCSSRTQHVMKCPCKAKAKETRRSRSKESMSGIANCECSRMANRMDDSSRTSGSEMASCSSAPTPPRRLLKKNFSPTKEKVQSWWWGGQRLRSEGVQRPQRADAASGPSSDRGCHGGHMCHSREPREASPSVQLEQRVQALHAALQRSQARWTHSHARDS